MPLFAEHPVTPLVSHNNGITSNDYGSIQYQSNQLNQLGLPNKYDNEDGFMVMGDPSVQHAPITKTIKEAAEQNQMMQRQRDIWGYCVLAAPHPPWQ